MTATAPAEPPEPGAGTAAGTPPAYLALADRLERRIATMEPGSRVASEHELVEATGVSRLTARAALQELERRLLVRRVRGSGTFVARRIEYRIGPTSPPSVSEMVRRAGGTPGSGVVAARVRRPDAATRDALGLDGRDRVVALTRVQTVDGLASAIGTSHVPVELAPDLADRMGANQSLYRLLVERYDLDPHRLWSRCELVAAPPEVPEPLGLEGRPLVWQLESCNHDPRRGRPIEYARSWLRPDVYRVVFELGRAEPG
jgi:DNA-binding GntR family transcriptional regulator